MNFVDIKGSLHDERILGVLSLSQYLPTKEKLERLADEYESDPTLYAFAYKDGDAVCGTIFLKQTGDGAFELKSIATVPNHRKQGIASGLISFAATTLPCSLITAETDDDAVGFYRKYGFQIQSLGEKYPGILRYRCTINL